MDILARIAAYDCSDGGHCDAAQGSAYDLLSGAKYEIERQRAALQKIANQYPCCEAPAMARVAREALGA